MKYLTAGLLITTLLFLSAPSSQAQTNLLLNGNFEDINTCIEYKAECGVEAWFYMKDVKAQMIPPAANQDLFGSNSFGLFYTWNGYTDFTPLIGTLLPCGLQKGKEYIFKGVISAKLNSLFVLTPGVCVGNKFYVPKRSFSKELRPDSITRLTEIPQMKFFSFEYRFTAAGSEKYLSFGTYIKQDTLGGKRVTGNQSIHLTIDNFELLPADEKEIVCPAFDINKSAVYNYDYRHKEMDYSLFGKGELAIKLIETGDNFNTVIKEPVQRVIKTDTLVLGDVLFDFNKAALKPEAINVLKNYFNNKSLIDSIYIQGHTDSIGSDQSNYELSRQRCQSVKDWLASNKVVSTENLAIQPFGRTRPVATNKTSQGRASNRRVEMIIFQKREE